MNVHFWKRILLLSAFTRITSYLAAVEECKVSRMLKPNRNRTTEKAKLRKFLTLNKDTVWIYCPYLYNSIYNTISSLIIYNFCAHILRSTLDKKCEHAWINTQNDTYNNNIKKRKNHHDFFATAVCPHRRKLGAFCLSMVINSVSNIYTRRWIYWLLVTKHLKLNILLQKKEDKKKHDMTTTTPTNITTTIKY